MANAAETGASDRPVARQKHKPDSFDTPLPPKPVVPVMAHKKAAVLVGTPPDKPGYYWHRNKLRGEHWVAWSMRFLGVTCVEEALYMDGDEFIAVAPPTDGVAQYIKELNETCPTKFI